jgi:uncharacterized protein YkwD
MDYRAPYISGALALSALLATAVPAAQADALSAVQTLRAGGCGGIVPIAKPLRHALLLDRTAQQWAGGRPLATAAEGSGYPGAATAGVHVSGPESGMLQLLKQSDCRTLTNRELRDIGVYHHGSDTWIVLVSAATTPLGTAIVAHATTAPLATRALELVNQARARGARCGAHPFGPAPPVTLSGTLGGVASGHALDMAEHNYFEHQDLAGHSPADRVRQAGYGERLVGENIAYGLNSVDEAVQGWLDSPDHCENIMDPRFAEMGIAYATGRTLRHGLYWVQLFAEPRE